MDRLLLCASIVVVASAPARAGADEREGTLERTVREAGRPDAGEPAATGKGAPGDSEALYAFGAILGSRVSDYHLSPHELARVQRGFADAAAGRKLELRDPDLEEWGPKVDSMLQRRGNPRTAAEKDRGRKVADAEARRPGAEKLANGVVVVPGRSGSGPRPAATDRVRVKYEGRLASGEAFDRSDGAELRLDHVISCWTQGLQRVQAGGSARLVCPAPTAYGDQGRPPQIPGGATLLFDIELLDVLR